jgi:PAS domain S-box-containing protein
MRKTKPERKSKQPMRKQPVPERKVVGGKSQIIRELKRSYQELKEQNAELVRSQTELKLSRERYADLYDCSPANFVTLTHSGMIAGISISATQILDLSRRNITGRPFVDFLSNLSKQAFREHLARCRSIGEKAVKPLTVELELAKKAIGWPVFIELVCLPVAGKKPHSLILKCIFLDISERKRQEGIIKAARDEAERANRAKDDFLATLSHELRTPLNPVLLIASDAISNYDLSPSVRASFDMIRRNVELEARLIDDLLDLARIRHGKLTLEKNPTRAHSILKETIALLQRDLEQKEISLKQKLAAPGDLVFADPVRLQQIFWNLFSNAVKFTPAKGTISVETSCSGGNEFSVTISDTGIGMSAHDVAYVFDAFVQGEHAAQQGPKKFGGLGLGLAIARKLVDLHSGSMEATSEGKDCGSTFTVRFPLLAAAEQTATATTPAPAAGGAPKRGIDILLVEDHGPTRSVLVQLLLRRHHKVKTAGSVKEARAMAADNKFDLLISDIGLPDGNGYELMEKLRKHSPLKGIALTGYGMDADIERSQEVGFAMHLTKPVNIHSLENALATVIASPA